MLALDSGLVVNIFVKTTKANSADPEQTAPLKVQSDLGQH